MHRVSEYLYYGPRLIDESKLRESGITHIFSCVGPPFVQLPGIVYEYIDIQDNIYQSLDESITKFSLFIHNVLDTSSLNRIYIHCEAGRSRSVSLVLGFLIIEIGMSFDKAFNYIKGIDPNANPNIGFIKQLKCLNI